MREDDKQDLKDSVSQIVDGNENQIAGRDIINNYIEQNRPRLLYELFPDELRVERDWSKQLIEDAKNKIWKSWPVSVLKYTVPFFLVFVVMSFYFKWSAWFVLAGILSVWLPFLIMLKVNEAELTLIQSRRKVVEYVYERLREFGIDER